MNHSVGDWHSLGSLQGQGGGRSGRHSTAAVDFNAGGGRRQERETQHSSRGLQRRRRQYGKQAGMADVLH